MQGAEPIVQKPRVGPQARPRQWRFDFSSVAERTVPAVANISSLQVVQAPELPV